ncbi:MAG: glycoside-pentoside-hexuronide (GPH):cation symporter [Pseudomonadales bacterium]|jgi:GPH family glycoside/pentoside/hexuronide:cation symporter|nr:glycoside-pentoside-hexuronide (GPH):cation symporter [Pseudomonadales bacterium]
MAETAAAKVGDGTGSRVPGSAATRLPFATVLTYSLPTTGIGFMFYLAVLFLMKFSTDVLLIAPAAVSLILGVSRVLDAITDPIAGYLSDRTRSPMGRRRPWLLGSAIPLAVIFVMMWAPPAGLQGTALTAWMAVSIIGFYALSTLVNVPHQSWGAELTSDYHERTRVFGMRLLLLNVGAFAAVGCLLIVDGSPTPRETVFWLAAAVATFTAVVTMVSALRLRERTELQGRGPQAVLGVYRDLARNPHARLLLAVFFIESLGGATIGVLTPYMAQYVILEISFPLVVLTYMVAMTLSVPFWTPLSRAFGKKRLWLVSMLVTALGFGSFFVLGAGDVVQTYVLAFVLGAAAGCGNVIAPSVQSDIIDWDEHQTGERKEGGYFAAFSFMQKSAAGVTIMLSGVVLQLAGYVPNTAQSETAQFAIRSLYALFPLSCYAIGAVLFLRFSLGEKEHGAIQQVLAARRAAGPREEGEGDP